MSSEEVRKKFLEFFEKRGHAIAPSSSLIPTDPSVLLTTAGMQQFKKYFMGELDTKKDFGSLNTVSIQKCFRTSDIDEVGDASHLTFFEMLGNFSFGGYFKEKAIEYGYEFITKEMGLVVDKVTIFDPAKVLADDWRKGVPFDVESEKFWKKYPVKIERAGIDNFWGPTGSEGPCGPTTEIYVKNAAGESIEIWNIVFNEFYCDQDKKLKPLKTPGVDTGMGLERLVMVSQKVSTIFDTDLFEPIMAALPIALHLKTKRVIADHVRGVAFLIADGILPSNKETGYVLRRLMRRIVVYGMPNVNVLFSLIAKDYGHFYENLSVKENDITRVFKEEADNFGKTLRTGLRELELRFPPGKNQKVGKEAFDLYQTFGLPVEIIKEELEKRGYEFDREEFEKENKKHQEISKAGAVRKFGGHGLILNTGELKAGDEAELKKVTRLHTATHLLHRALHEVLGNDVHQMGSDITTERTRFDFSFSRKMTSEELKNVEEIVNEKVKEDLPVQFKEMAKDEAEKTGALHFFKEKYPARVKVYYIGKDLNSAWSKEFCGGPHVTHTGEIGHIKILKEEAVGAGARRLRATVE